jgi:hypothetical protein
MLFFCMKDLMYNPTWRFATEAWGEGIVEIAGLACFKVSVCLYGDVY